MLPTSGLFCKDASHIDLFIKRENTSINKLLIIYTVLLYFYILYIVMSSGGNTRQTPINPLIKLQKNTYHDLFMLTRNHYLDN